MLAAFALAPLAGENCGGSLAVDPRFCTTRTPEGGFYCLAAGLEIGDTVPFRVRLGNRANYEDIFGNVVFIPGEFQANKYVQITFTCLDKATCSVVDPDVLEYKPCAPGENSRDHACGFRAGTGADGAPLPVDFSMGCGSGGIGTEGCKDGGVVPKNFGGIDKCSGIVASQGAEAAAKSCGHMKITANIPVGGDSDMTAGTVFMKVVGRPDSRSMVAYVDGDEALFRTEGGICTGGSNTEELAATGSGTTQAGFADGEPPPPSPPPSSPPPSCPELREKFDSPDPPCCEWDGVVSPHGHADYSWSANCSEMRREYKSLGCCFLPPASPPALAP